MTKIVPLIVLAVIVAMMLVGVDYKLYNFNATVRCAAMRMEKKSPASDVVIVGSSRISAAIDPVFLSDLLSERFSREVTVERISATGAEIGFWIGLADIYVQERGYPKVVLIELPFGGGRGIETDRAVLHTASSKLLSTQSRRDTQLNGLATRPIANYFDTSKLSYREIILRKSMAGFFGTLNYAGKKLFGKQNYFCKSPHVWKTWPYGELSSSDLEILPENLVSDKEFNKFEKRNERRMSRDPNLENRRNQNWLLTELINTLTNDDDQELRLVLVPHAGDSWTSEYQSSLEKLFPGIELINLLEFIENANDGKLTRAFRNGSHLNYQAAAFVTKYIATELPDFQ